MLDIPEGWIAVALIVAFLLAICVLNLIEFGRPD
jgi:hypothetical protein